MSGETIDYQDALRLIPNGKYLNIKTSEDVVSEV